MKDIRAEQRFVVWLP